MTLDQIQTSQLTLTSWIAPNPFGEPAAFALVHPTSAAEVPSVCEVIEMLGLKRLDAAGDILPVGTGTLFASLRALRVELCTENGVWCEQAVSDEWIGTAIARRYIVLAVGTEIFSTDALAEDIANYVQQHHNVFTALVKIRVRFE